jgi:hypothetical protein
MPHDIRVITVGELIRTDVSGMLDMAATSKALLDLAAVSYQHPRQHILFDVRRATDTNLTLSQVYELASLLTDLGLGVQSRLAVLAGARIDEFDRAHFFETVAQNRNGRVRAFRDFEQAFEWLAQGS